MIGFDEHHMGSSVANPESDGLSLLAGILEEMGHEVDRIEEELPVEDGLPWDVIVLPFPKLKFTAEEMLALHEHMRAGRGLLLLTEWGDLYAHVDHLNELTAPYGIHIQKDRVTDLEEHVSHQVKLGGIVLDEQPVPHYVRIRNFSEHPITEGLQEIVYFSGCSLKTSEPAVAVASTAATSFGDLDLDIELDDDEEQGILTIAAASEMEGRMLVVGDSNIAANGYVEQGDNLAFIIQAIEWLLRER